MANHTTALPCVKEDSKIQLAFKLSLADGTLVEQADEEEKFVFTLGDGTLIPNLESMLIGLEQGTTAKLTLSPERAFGLRDSANFQNMSRQDFPEDMELQVGYVVGFNTPTGDEVPGTIHEVDGDEVVVDFNHPLAGATVQFDAKVITVFS
mgnify:CR=1 FL=1